MPELTLTTLITAASTLVAAIIGAVGTYIAASREKAKGDQTSASRSHSWLKPVLVTVSSAFVGLVIGFLLGSRLVGAPPGDDDKTQLSETSPTPPISTPARHQIYDELDALLGSDNWECLPGWPYTIGIREIPPDFVVSSPLTKVDVGKESYQEDDPVPAGLPATGWLYRSLPDNPCSVERPNITQSDLNQIFGAGNWSCLGGFREGISVESIPAGYVVDSPVSAVDQYDTKYFLDEAVPSGAPAVVWLQNYLDEAQCP
jgi:hypothetical protein